MSLTCARSAPTAAALALVVGACANGVGVSSGEPPEVGDAEVVRQQIAEDLVIALSLDTTQSSTGRFLAIVVVAANTGTADLRARVGGCFWQLALYEHAERTGDAIWRFPTVCGEPLLPLTIAAGETKEWPMHGLVIDDFVSAHGAGTYYFTVELVLFEPRVSSGERPVAEIHLQ